MEAGKPAPLESLEVEEPEGKVPFGYAKPGKATFLGKIYLSLGHMNPAGIQRVYRTHADSFKADGFTFGFTRDV